MYRCILKKSLCLVAIANLLALPCFAYNLDDSADEEIRRNYNPSRLEQESLPPLPKTTGANSKTVTTKSKTTTSPTPAKSAVPSTVVTVPKTVPTTPSTEPIIKKVNKNLPNSTLTKDDFTSIKIKKGTKFRVKSSSVVSDNLPEGAKVSFTTLAPVTQRYVTIPAGTVITATVKDSHQPQITGNGGLVVLSLESIKFKSGAFPTHGKVTKANQKYIFLNNIKGKRQYWKNVVTQIDKGEKFYQKSRAASSKLSNNPVGAVVASVPTIVGTAGYMINLALSPIISISGKGGRISIPAGSEFELKLQENVYLNL